jgi:hypothetical protein
VKIRAAWLQSKALLQQLFATDSITLFLADEAEQVHGIRRSRRASQELSTQLLGFWQATLAQQLLYSSQQRVGGTHDSRNQPLML